ncbi:hypothetical protein LTR91_012280 [Friedmanniomyces endolithicus]|uniref:CENP-V/GFA domain-containing protein n=1 Tax=Friedmanniomyces endolithicus TaxID=329885 RepID=A0AAN6KG31_9PEZI|nr:hypothetical protein LTS02_005328 [Friedmanniomyces endolithicus]KAK0883428.1 hypothetical protein LTR87_002704 [Friedmanniomyces endolithicus]KAK0902349.1 hypothetical protein LTR57_019711 [Friedmanniomyces endolithicus]KAK0964590.1 hypothetical protein LTS01_018755 [Friedmanniomyces endolithicus]KAK0980449.1 hypothetical protein LTR91_012280 [Friedmanniomyces endolithicus]
MEGLTHLFGTCACQRNQYTIVIPPSSASLAQVILDNSSTANPWLRVPLDWHHSATFALFPDETHASIKRTFYSTPPSLPSPTSADPVNPASRPPPPPTRRQFCGYCGTQLTAWNEGLHGQGGSGRGGGFIDVAVGSLEGESLERLESLRLDGKDEDEDSGVEEGAGARVSGDTHGTASAVEGRVGMQRPGQRETRQSMGGSGVSYYESSWLGRIKRRKGGHTSADGTRTVEWEIVEMEGDDEGERAGEEVDDGNGAHKSMRVDA